jgi:CheY-like chemotaxis protein
VDSFNYRRLLERHVLSQTCLQDQYQITSHQWEKGIEKAIKLYEHYHQLLMMPLMDGFEVCQFKTTDVPVTFNYSVNSQATSEDENSSD